MEALTRASVLVTWGSALSDPTRPQILLVLAAEAGYPRGLPERIGVSRQRRSTHRACLCGCGLVVAALPGRGVRYELADPRFGVALSGLLDVVPASGRDQCHRWVL